MVLIAPTYVKDTAMVPSSSPFVEQVSSLSAFTNPGGVYMPSGCLNWLFGSYPATVLIRKPFRRSFKIIRVIMEAGTRPNQHTSLSSNGGIVGVRNGVEIP